MTAPIGMREDTLKVGLLMESAQAHQAMVAENLRRLQSHIRDLDTVVRDEIRRTLLEELQALSTESNLAAQALRRVGSQAHARVAAIAVAAVMLFIVIAIGLLAWLVPSPAQIFALRAQGAELESALLQLRTHGAAVEWRRCGEERRLCIRIDRKAPTYGEQGDFLIAKGY